MIKASYYTLLWWMITFLVACHSFRNNSEVAQFDYQGYGDTTLSLMYGKVFENLNGKKSPLPKVQITVVNAKETTFSDLEGNFNIWTKSGTYHVLVSKEGYQSMLLKNYEAFSDRVSRTEIVLVKGKGAVFFEIPVKHF